MTDVHTCGHCRRCAAEALGINLGDPLTPAQFRALEEYQGIAPTGAPPVDLDVSADPGVAKAAGVLGEREAAFQPYEQAWVDAAALLRDTELLADSRLESVAVKSRNALPRLRDELRECSDERDRQWSRVVKARLELRGAVLAAQHARFADGPGVKTAPAAERKEVRVSGPGAAFVKTPPRRGH